MDTRQKIVETTSAETLTASAGARRIIVIAGFFDVLSARMVHQLKEIRASNAGAWIVAAVLDPEEPLLSNRARCELAAGLNAIDQVVSLSKLSLTDFMAESHEAVLIDEREAHERISADLVQHVQQRQSA